MLPTIILALSTDSRYNLEQFVFSCVFHFVATDFNSQNLVGMFNKRLKLTTLVVSILRVSWYALLKRRSFVHDCETKGYS